MSTYNHQKVIADYANGHITPEMAVGHGLQHIDKLYEAQTTANLSRHELRSEVDTLTEKVNTLQVEVTRLRSLLEKSLASPQ